MVTDEDGAYQDYLDKEYQKWYDVEYDKGYAAFKGGNILPPGHNEAYEDGWLAAEDRMFNC